MALRCFAGLLVLANVAAQAPSPRPDLDDWEKKKADEADAAAGVAAKSAKMAAVEKVLTLLGDLKSEVMAEGEKEAKMYNKFACFCHDTTKEKHEAITKGDDEKAQAYAEIMDSSSKRANLDQMMADHQTQIAVVEKAMGDATDLRTKTKKEYDGNAADMKSALDSLEGAIGHLKASKKPSLAQFKAVASTVRTATLLADALGVGDTESRRAAQIFLQDEPANEVQMEDYKFHSDDIITTLEKLHKDFTDEKNQVDADEVSSIASHDKFMQESTHAHERLTHNLEEMKKSKEETAAEIASTNQHLSTVEATYRDNVEYLGKLSKVCTGKGAAWEQRSTARANEINMLSTAIAFISGEISQKVSAKTIRFAQQGMSMRLAKAVARNPSAMEAIEADAEAAEATADAPAFVQLSRRLSVARVHSEPEGPAEGRDFVAKLLASRGQALKSTVLTSLANKIAGDPLAKVKTLIQELVERLLQEQANEANQKGWCDKALGDATQKRTYAAEEVRTLNSEMARLEALRDKLREDVSGLVQEINELNAARTNATNERAEEQAANMHTIEEAQEGLEGITEGIRILTKFYATMKKGSVSFAQADPLEDMPDAGFDVGEAYTGKQSGITGIVGMLEVMQSDFARTVSETQAAEKQAQQDHLELMTATGKSLSQAQQAHEETATQLDAAMEDFDETHDSMDMQMERLKTAIQELLELQAPCVNTGMSYAERRERRKDEIESLKKALCIFSNYASGGADSC